MVDKAAELADDVCVGAFTCIGPGVRIGPGCVIENNVTIVGQTTIGARTRVSPLAVIGVAETPGETPGQCLIGEASALREHVTVYGGQQAPTRIGNDDLIMIGCQVGAGADVGDHVILANCTHVGAGARVEDYVRTSGFTTVAPGATVGAFTFTAGYSEVHRDVPPFAMIQGCPVRIRGVNTNNLRRCGFGEDAIRQLKDAFRELFDGVPGKVHEAALRRLEADATAGPHVRRLIEAARRSLGRGHSDG